MNVHQHKLRLLNSGKFNRFPAGVRDADNAMTQPAKPSPQLHGDEGFILDDKNIEGKARGFRA
jgi:hypothetical protein